MSLSRNFFLGCLAREISGMNNIISMRDGASHSRSALTRSRNAFTLVELLVVIAIIGVLVALLLPAIQAARESARNAQCKNNLKQIGLAMLNYESSNRTFPAGGWSFRWMGDPNQGMGARQPGGWIYQVAPYMENQNVTMVGGGLSGDALKQALKQQLSATMPSFNCPSRRPAVGYPALEKPFNCELPDTAAKSDYAANAGSREVKPAAGLPLPNATFTDCLEGYPACGWAISDSRIAADWNGIVCSRTGARIGQISDGTSKTIAAGEKWVMAKFYEMASEREPSFEGNDNPGDNGSMYLGYDWDSIRWANGEINGSGQPEGSLPRKDTEVRTDGGQAVGGATYILNFGGPHASTMNLVYADGSTHSVEYDIDPLVWNAMGGRDDGDIN
jgi:prepilin-type N-terminal cleavage/methylation domain-containing protein